MPQEINQLENTKNNNVEKTFFTKKRIILFSIAIVVFVLIVFFTSKFLFDINFEVIGNLIYNSYKTNNLFFLWLVLLIVFPLYNCFFRIYPYLYKLKKKGFIVEWYNWLIFCFVTFFIGGITPFAMGSEPYIIYWLKKRGLSLKEATALVASFTVINPFIQVLITWPSFFYLCSLYGSLSHKVEWNASFWTVLVGLVIDLLGTIFWTLMSYSKNAHYWLNILINFFKRILKMKYKTKDEIRHEYKENAAFKKLFLAELKDWKFVLLLVLGSISWNVLYYSEMIFAFNFMDPGFRFNALDLFNYTNVATTANNFIPIPGAEGTLQAVLSMFISNSPTSIHLPEKEISEIANNSVFIWRTFTFYITTIIGAIFFIVLIVKEFYKFRVKKFRIKRNLGENQFIFIIRNLDNNIWDTLNSIKRIDYNLDLVKIYLQDGPFAWRVKSDKTFNDLNICTIKIANNSNDKFLRAIIKKEKDLDNKFINIINSGDRLCFNTLSSMESIFHNYDIFAFQYRDMDKMIIRLKHNPFIHLFIKRIKNIDMMSTPRFKTINFFISLKLINKTISNGTKLSDKDIIFYSQLLENINNLRFIKKTSSYKVVDCEQYNLSFEDLDELAALNPQIITYLVASKKYRNIIGNDRKLKIHQKSNYKWLPIYLRFFYKIYYKIVTRNNYLELK